MPLAVTRMTRVLLYVLVVLSVALGVSSSAQSRWWMHEPIRFLQTNLREIDSTVDPKALVQGVAEFPANTFLVNMGGIVAQYPTRVALHYPSAICQPDAICSARCCARRMRVACGSSGDST
jgi:hypothetical protein